MSIRDYKNEVSVENYGDVSELNFDTDTMPHSIVMLYEYILVEIEETRRMVLFHVEPFEKPLYRHHSFYHFTVIENPSNFLRNCIWHPDKTIPFTRCTFYIERKATNYFPQKIFQIKFSKRQEQVESPLVGRVDVMKIHNVLNMKCYAMPPEFYRVMKGEDSSCRYHIKAGDNYQFFLNPPIIKEVIKEVVREVIKKQIPKHIFDIVVNQAIEKKEDCPVLCIPFTRENASCGPCGHLVSYEALLRCVQDKEQCPVCREKMNIQDIQKV
jgi:hypothetical protein